MKFGLEAEKFIYDMESKRPSQRVFSILDALSDFDGMGQSKYSANKPTNEFVLSMIEFGTIPSDDPLNVLRDYLLNYQMVQEVAKRNHISMVPLGSLPLDYNPKMAPKLAYYIQNSILCGERLNDWSISPTSPLKIAGNCAGIHVHVEIETAREFLFLNDELVNKFNMGLMLTPLIAFSSSPYFYGVNEARSMRGHRYFEVLYKNFPLNGGLPPVLENSGAILEYLKTACDHWSAEGMRIGFSEEEMNPSSLLKSNNWSPIRWNRRWNTIEIRCLDSDLIDLDAAKFVWICSAMRGMDLKGEALKCKVIQSALSHDVIDQCFEVSNGEVSILSTEAIRELFHRAIMFGTRDEMVERYLLKLSEFCRERLTGAGEKQLFDRLLYTLKEHSSTSDLLMSKTHHVDMIDNDIATDLIAHAVGLQSESIETLKSNLQQASIFMEFGSERMVQERAM